MTVELELEDMFADTFPEETAHEEETTETTDAGKVTETEPEIVETMDVEQEVETTADITSVQSVYDVLKDYVPLNEGEVNEDFLRSELENLPSKFFLNYVESRPQIVQDLLTFQANAEEVTPESLATFFETYLKPKTTFDIETTEGAREYLKTRPELKKFYKTDEKLDMALDTMEDDNELLDRAKELWQEDEVKREEAKKNKIEEEKRNKEEKAKAQLLFAKQIQDEVEKLPWDKKAKEEALREINATNISTKWQSISTNPSHLPQFGKLLSYYTKETGFQKLFDILEGKNKSKSAQELKKTISQDSLGKVLNRNPPKEKDNIEDFFK